jgi:hypothetical protein
VEPIFVSIRDTAKMLGITPWSVYQILKLVDCPLDARYYGKRRLVSVESIRRYAESLPTEPPEESA